ncbi:PREDICTED: zinc finger protein 518B [Chrysochloris asiatica]|uniref:Zinc finger protein 518B n=1 Tax=Chrysochloris asiatica TaxID=185453 RepID=A0A9B0U998_CHRAS|nr:PREDICTED: zinc finger protein 518B [Chrysochloris asiatica]
MQIKKMTDIGQQLYVPQVNDRQSSLTMSPTHPDAGSVVRPHRQEAPALLYDGPARDVMMTTAMCVKCTSVCRVPLQDFLKGTGQSPNKDHYVCFKCSLGVPPAHFHFVDNHAGSPQVGNIADAISSSISNNKFKVRNFKPGKYYCDKCRFSTKDPLQYKKHTLQHEEIKFICSHCSYISYTKGEFQRHLVKHTGIFPYRCEYCDYGAIRNDYIVKHRRRVHEKTGGKQSPKAVAKLEPPSSSTPKPILELLNTSNQRTAFQNQLSDQLSRFSLHAQQDRMQNIMLVPEPKEYQKDGVCVPNKVTLAEPCEGGLFENKSVEVEVLSPAKEPVQPGMPLTVVAPSELVVPANCLAQLLDVKVVNGTQQLVLKLFPLEENSCLEVGGHDGGTPELVTKEKSPKILEKAAASEQTKPLMMEGNTGAPAGLDRLQSPGHQQPPNVKWVKPYHFLTSNSSGQHQGDSFLSSDRVEDLQGTNHLFAQRTAPPPCIALKGHSLSPTAKTSVPCGLGTASSPFSCKAAVACSEDGRNLHSGPQSLLPLTAPPPAAFPFCREKGLLPISENGLKSRSEISIPLKMVSSSRKLKDTQIEAAAKPGQVSSQHHSEYLHINLAGEDGLRPQQPGGKPVEFQNSERDNDCFDGPVISSVFSLSSGSQNVPEGIKWNSSPSKIKSIELLRRKIAQLMESCGKPSSLAANNAHRRCEGRASKVTSKATLESIQELGMPFTGPGCPTGPPQNSQDNGQPIRQQIHPQFVDGPEEETGSRLTRQTHGAAPVLIPKGAVLRVLNSSEDAHIIEATCDTPVSIPCSETQLRTPTPFCPVKQTDLQISTNESGPVDMSQNLEMSPQRKPKKDSTVCSILPGKTSPPPGQQSGSEWSKPGKLLSRSLAISGNKSKQVNSSKKNKNIQADSRRGLKGPSIFQVARQLRLIAAKRDQLIKCPRRNQPVIVLNHPDVDSLEVTNVMKVINKYKGNVLKVVLSERTRCQLGFRRHQVRLTYQNAEEASQIKRQMMLKMKLKKVHKNNYQVVGSLPTDSSQSIFKCWFCGRLYEDQEEWMSHGQRHLIEATRDWDVLSSKGK